MRTDIGRVAGCQHRSRECMFDDCDLQGRKINFTNSKTLVTLAFVSFHFLPVSIFDCVSFHSMFLVFSLLAQKIKKWKNHQQNRKTSKERKKRSPGGIPRDGFFFGWFWTISRILGTIWSDTLYRNLPYDATKPWCLKSGFICSGGVCLLMLCDSPHSLQHEASTVLCHFCQTSSFCVR